MGRGQKWQGVSSAALFLNAPVSTEPSSLSAVETRRNYVRFSQIVMAITAGLLGLGDTFFGPPKANQSTPKRGREKKGIRCHACSISSRLAIGWSNSRIGRHG